MPDEGSYILEDGTIIPASEFHAERREELYKIPGPEHRDPPGVARLPAPSDKPQPQTMKPRTLPDDNPKQKKPSFLAQQKQTKSEKPIERIAKALGKSLEQAEVFLTDVRRAARKPVKLKQVSECVETQGARTPEQVAQMIVQIDFKKRVEKIGGPVDSFGQTGKKSINEDRHGREKKRNNDSGASFYKNPGVKYDNSGRYSEGDGRRHTSGGLSNYITDAQDTGIDELGENITSY